jgi:hypothetical protein
VSWELILERDFGTGASIELRDASRYRKIAAYKINIY